MDDGRRAAVADALADSVRLGLIGSGRLDDHIDHALAMAATVSAGLGRPPARLLDLGSGGGLPGVVLAALWPECDIVLLDAAARRGEVLGRALDRLGADHARVLVGRAEALGHDESLREHFQVVTARAFGPPAATAECATAFVEVGGVVAVTEPVEPDPERWPEAGLAALGLRLAGRTAAPAFVVFEKVAAAPPTTPRSIGRPVKRPLW